MRHLKRPQLFMACFTLALVLLVGGFVYTSSASTARFYVFGPITATCNATGGTAAAGYQGTVFGTELQGFQDSEPVYLSFTFPDGRVFSPYPASFGAVNSPYGLDGVIDMPPNFPWVFTASRGGDFYYDFQTNGKWPYGCYTFTALGAQSNRQSSGSFVVLPGGGPAAQPGPTTLSVQDNTTGDASSQQGALVDIFGRGFLGQEVVSVWFTGPNGQVLDYPQQQASDIGSFASTFTFSGDYPTGQYTFTALGTQSGYRVFANFNLTSRPSLETGYADLRVAQPFDTIGDQRTTFEVQGKRFGSGERIDIWVTLPDGAVRGLPSQFANEYGEFFVRTYLDERLPTGLYHFTAKGADTGRLTIIDLTLDGGSPNVTTAPIIEAAPVVTGSNTDGNTVGPATDQTPLQVQDPQPEPSF